MIRNNSTTPSCLYLHQHNSGFSQNSSVDPMISLEMNEDYGGNFSFQSEGINQNNLNYLSSAVSSDFCYFTPAVAPSLDTFDAGIAPEIYPIPSSKADKETRFGQPLQSDNSRASRKRPLFSGLISKSAFPDDLKRLKAEHNEQTMDAGSVKVATRRSQKLSDKIASLQKVVSPYGKTDTSSVLQETCLYIKIAQQEIRRLAVSNFGSRSRAFFNPQLMHGSIEKWSPDLQSRGLCLVPMSVTNQLIAEDVTESSSNRQGVTTVMDSWRF